MKKTAKLIACLSVALVFLTLIVCLIFKIHIFTFSLKSEYVERVDCIEGYYVAVYNETVCKYNKDDMPAMAMGNCSDITDFDWKHEEMMEIVSYKRFLCFSKKTEPEAYVLFNSDKTVGYGTMYVLRTSNDTVHYYYQRYYQKNDSEWSEYLFAENISFNYEGNEIALSNYCSFSSDTDFTSGENILCINDEPCYFSRLNEH